MNDVFSLEGRTAVVTGGSRGIGAATARLFVQHGARVLVCHHGDEANAASLCAGSAGRITSMACDVSDARQVAALRARALESLGQVDILVNCAGVGGGDKPFEQTGPRDWDVIVGVNLKGTIDVTRAFFGDMCARGFGRVINIASQLAYKGASGLAYYCAAKAGVVGFTRALSYEGAPRGVLVNAIAPGPVDTELLRGHSDAWLRDKRAQLPVGRFGEVEEIAPTALLLASAAGAFYSGQTLSPNGGDVML